MLTDEDLIEYAYSFSTQALDLTPDEWLTTTDWISKRRIKFQLWWDRYKYSLASRPARTLLPLLSVALLTGLVATWGLVKAFRMYQRRQARLPPSLTTWLSEQSLQERSPLSPDLMIVIRLINDKNQPARLLPDDMQRGSGTTKRSPSPTLSRRWMEIWETVGSSLLSAESPDVSPVVVPSSQGALSFVRVPRTALKSSPSDPIPALVQALKARRLWPQHTPRRGPLSEAKVVAFDTSVVEGQLLPELVLTLVV